MPFRNQLRCKIRPNQIKDLMFHELIHLYRGVLLKKVNRLNVYTLSNLNLFQEMHKSAFISNTSLGEMIAVLSWTRNICISSFSAGGKGKIDVVMVVGMDIYGLKPHLLKATHHKTHTMLPGSQSEHCCPTPWPYPAITTTTSI